MRFVGWVMVAVSLLVGGCGVQVRRAHEALQEWAESVRGTYPGVTVEQAAGLFGPAGAVLVNADLTSTDQAMAFSRDVDARIASLGRKAAVTVRITWPVDGGTAILEQRETGAAPPEAWEWAAAPLPDGATAVHIGWSSNTHVRRPAGVPAHQFWPLVQFVGDDLTSVLRDLPEVRGADVSVVTTGHALGPFPGVEAAARGAEFAALPGVADLRVEGLEVFAAAAGDLPGIARSLPGHAWTVRSGRSSVESGPGTQAYLDQAEDLLRDGVVVSLTASSFGLSPSDCDAFISGAPTNDIPYVLECAPPGADRMVVTGSPEELRHDWPLVRSIRDAGASWVIDGLDSLAINLGRIPDDERAAALLPARDLTWEGERRVSLSAGSSLTVDFVSTATGRASDPAWGDFVQKGRQKALVRAWDESAS